MIKKFKIFEEYEGDFPYPPDGSPMPNINHPTNVTWYNKHNKVYDPEEENNLLKILKERESRLNKIPKKIIRVSQDDPLPQRDDSDW